MAPTPHVPEPRDPSWLRGDMAAVLALKGSDPATRDLMREHTEKSLADAEAEATAAWRRLRWWSGYYARLTDTLENTE